MRNNAILQESETRARRSGRAARRLSEREVTASEQKELELAAQRKGESSQ